MKRLWFTILNDIRLQWRNGFYTVMGIALGVWILLRTQTSGLELEWLMGVLVAGNLIITGFYFIAALVLLERDEGSLTAQAVTPLRPWEYLTSKAVSLFILGLIENVIIVVLYAGVWLNWAALIGGTLIVFLIYLCCGLIMITRFDSINSFLLPSVLVVIAIVLPMITILTQWEHWLVYLHPLQAGMVMLNGAFTPQPGWAWVYAVFYGIAVISGLVWFAFRMTRKHIFVGGL